MHAGVMPENLCNSRVSQHRLLVLYAVLQHTRSRIKGRCGLKLLKKMTKTFLESHVFGFYVFILCAGKVFPIENCRNVALNLSATVINQHKRVSAASLQREKKEEAEA